MKQCPHCGKRIVVDVTVEVRPPAVSTYRRLTRKEREAQQEAQYREAQAEARQAEVTNQRWQALQEEWRAKRAAIEAEFQAESVKGS